MWSLVNPSDEVWRELIYAQARVTGWLAGLGWVGLGNYPIHFTKPNILLHGYSYYDDDHVRINGMQITQESQRYLEATGLVPTKAR